MAGHDKNFQAKGGKERTMDDAKKKKLLDDIEERAIVCDMEYTG